MTGRQCLVALAVMLGVASARTAGFGGAEIRQYVSSDDYIAPAFTQGWPYGICLYFIGDSPHLQAAFSNDSPRTARIDLPAEAPPFSARLRELDAHIMPGGRSEDLRLEPLGSPALRLADGTLIPMTAADRAVNVQPGERVLWRFAIAPDEPLSPGFHAIQVSSNWRCIDGCRINPINSFVAVEMREPSSREDRLERFYRSALVSLWAGRLADAETSISDLLASYPDSAVALTVQGKIAERRGDVDSAVTAYRAGLSLLAERRDTILLSRSPSHDSKEMEFGLRSDIERLQRRR